MPASRPAADGVRRPTIGSRRQAEQPRAAFGLVSAGGLSAGLTPGVIASIAPPGRSQQARRYAFASPAWRLRPSSPRDSPFLRQAVISRRSWPRFLAGDALLRHFAPDGDFSREHRLMRGFGRRKRRLLIDRPTSVSVASRQAGDAAPILLRRLGVSHAPIVIYTILCWYRLRPVSCCRSGMKKRLPRTKAASLRQHRYSDARQSGQKALSMASPSR